MFLSSEQEFQEEFTGIEYHVERRSSQQCMKEFFSFEMEFRCPIFLFPKSIWDSLIHSRSFPCNPNDSHRRRSSPTDSHGSPSSSNQFPWMCIRTHSFPFISTHFRPLSYILSLHSQMHSQYTQRQ